MQPLDAGVTIAPAAPVEWALSGPIAASYHRTHARPLASPLSCNYNKRRGGRQYGLILLSSPRIYPMNAPLEAPHGTGTARHLRSL